MSGRWVILAERSRLRWGGDLRRAHLFEVLAERTGATMIDGWSRAAVRSAIRRPRFGLGRRARIASAEFLGLDALAAAVSGGDPAVLDVHDDPLLQTAALGVSVAPHRAQAIAGKTRDNIAAFRWLVTPSRALAELMGLDLQRVVVAGNGTNTELVRPGPWPTEPAVGLVSGAAPGRGIETLIEAARGARTQVPDLRLLLWLAATGDASAEYLRQLRVTTAGEAWIEYGSAPYDQIGQLLAQAVVLVVPSPPHPYWDAISPVKLFDCLAAGRPVVVSPRPDPAAIVTTAEAGLVAGSDGPADLAAAILELLEDDSRARRYGANARRAAQANYDWRTIGARLADQVLGRER